MTQPTRLSTKREQLARMLRQKKEAYSFPLSHGQQALWFIHRDAPESPAYHMAWPLELRGDLSIEALKKALQTLVDRHPALRATIDDASGEPIQTVHPTGVARWRYHPPSENLADGMKNAYEQPFDLARGPALRADCFAMGDQRHVLLLTLHHLLGDASSLNLLGDEWLTLYAAEMTGTPANLPPLADTYADYVRAEAQWLDREPGQAALGYWRKRLDSANPLLSLPADYPRPAVRAYRGDSVPVAFSAELGRRMKTLARQEQTTLFALLTAAFQTLLHRYSGQADIWIGTPTATARTRFANVVGYFVNPVVLTANFDPAPTFRECLATTQTTVLEALEHAAYPFSHLVKTLHPRRDFSHAPLFQVLIDFHAAELSPLPRAAGGVTMSVLDMPQMEGQFDLSLSLSDGADGPRGWMRYNREVFRRETIQAMVGHWEVLLTAALEQPDQPITQLPWLQPAEIARLQAWNATEVAYPRETTLTAWFERQAASCQDQTALVAGDQRLTYRELNRQANQLAHFLSGYLPAEGETPRLAIAMERSVEMVVGLLAILKAGGAYVPVDPSYPTARIAFMLQDCGAPLLLSQSHLRARLPLERLTATVVWVDQVAVQDQSTANPPLRRTASDPAYVIYTSGSTGKPKGAINAHAGIINRLQWMQEAFGLDAADRVAQKTPFSFDVSVWEFFWPLLTGATLVMAKPEGHRDPAYLAALIAEQGITTLHFVPSMLRAFLAHAEFGSGVKRVICSGEALDADLVAQFHRATSTVELHNLYGPTEAAVDVTHWPCRREENASVIPIGKPIANTRLYVVDRNHQILPPGVPGELCIAGVQVGLGYLHRPELSAERFTTLDVLGRAERIYKTGDLVKWLPDGNLEYLGRMDQQIKLRGLRIELGEIEAALNHLPEIDGCAVVARELEGASTQLVAYLVALDRGVVTVPWLRERLGEKLPEYMVPTRWVFLAALPLSPNGKIDRKALPEPTLESSGYVYPRDDIELRLARLWEELFARAPIGVRDDFFDQGGDSILAIRLLAGIKQTFGVTVPLHGFFQHRTVEQLACVIRHDQTPAAWSPLVCLQPKGDQTPLFFVHASGGSAFDYVEIAALLGEDRPFYAVQPRGMEPGETFHPSILDMATDYARAVREIQPQGPYLLAGWSFGGTVIYEMARIFAQTGDESPILIMIDPPAPGAKLYHDDDLNFLLDRVPHYHGVSLAELDAQDSREEQTLYILNQIKMSGLFTPDIDKAFTLNWFELYKHHNQIVGAYHPTGRVNTKIIFYKPSVKTDFDAQMGQPVSAWRDWPLRGMEVIEAPGNHFDMVSPANTPVLVESMKQCIARDFEGARG